jgi:hypothetical protein
MWRSDNYPQTMKWLIILTAAWIIPAVRGGESGPQAFKFKLPELPSYSLGEEIRKGGVTAPLAFDHSASEIDLGRRVAPPTVAHIRMSEPRTDTDFKILIKEPDPTIDSKFVKPAAVKVTPRK